jgi:hypothetical protein
MALVISILLFAWNVIFRASVIAFFVCAMLFLFAIANAIVQDVRDRLAQRNGPTPRSGTAAQRLTARGR